MLYVRNLKGIKEPSQINHYLITQKQTMLIFLYNSFKSFSMHFYKVNIIFHMSIIFMLSFYFYIINIFHHCAVYVNKEMP